MSPSTPMPSNNMMLRTVFEQFATLDKNLEAFTVSKLLDGQGWRVYYINSAGIRTIERPTLDGALEAAVNAVEDDAIIESHASDPALSSDLEAMLNDIAPLKDDFELRMPPGE